MDMFQVDFTYSLFTSCNTVGLHYTTVLYNMKSDITRSDRGPRIMESMTEHFYAKWHEIRN